MGLSLKIQNLEILAEIFLLQSVRHRLFWNQIIKTNGLEILALQKEYEELMDKIGEYEDILGSRKTMTKTIKKDLKKIKKNMTLRERLLLKMARKLYLMRMLLLNRKLFLFRISLDIQNFLIRSI